MTHAIRAELTLRHPDWARVQALRGITPPVGSRLERAFEAALTQMGGWALVERYWRSGYAPPVCHIHGRECGILTHCPHTPMAISAEMEAF